MSNERKSIEEMTADTEKPVRDRKNWVAFVESDAVNFMTLNEMEKMTLDDGSGTDRTILSGIRHYYQPEQLIGKTAVAVLNLPPRKMMGIPSCGMLISAVHKEKGEEKLHLLLLDDAIPAGAKLC